MATEKDLKELALKAQKGSKQDYETLLIELEKITKAYLYKHLYFKEDLTDIVQEVLLAIHKALHTFNTDKIFLVWFFSIVKYKFTDYLRRYYKEKNNVSIEQIENFETTYSSDDKEPNYFFQNDFDNYIKILNKKQQTILKMYFIDELKGDEIATKLKLSISDIRVTIHRSIKKIQTHFNLNEQ